MVRNTTDPLLPDNPSAGFSLIDVLVALMLLAVLSGLMVSFTSQFRSLQRIAADVSSRSELNQIIAYLEQSIGEAMPLPFIQNSSETRPSFEGTASRLRFVTIARQGTRSRALRETTIELAGVGTARRLVQTFEPRRLDKERRDLAAMSIDLAEVTFAAFAYLDQDASTGEAIWRQDWVERLGLPKEVRIELGAERNGRTVIAAGQAVLRMSTDPAETMTGTGGL